MEISDPVKRSLACYGSDNGTKANLARNNFRRPKKEA
jgi:hypothetical protein